MTHSVATQSQSAAHGNEGTTYPEAIGQQPPPGLHPSWSARREVGELVERFLLVDGVEKRGISWGAVVAF